MGIGTGNPADRAVREQIFQCIADAQTVVLCRHVRPDGDAVGSTKGFAALLRAGFPDKRVLVINSDSADYLAFTGGEDAPIPADAYADALVLCLDCATTDRLSNPLVSRAGQSSRLTTTLTWIPTATFPGWIRLFPPPARW